MKIKRENVEILDQKHQMIAEGTCDENLTTREVREFLSREGYVSYNIDISFDEQLKCFRFICDIEKF